MKAVTRAYALPRTLIATLAGACIVSCAAPSDATQSAPPNRGTFSKIVAGSDDGDDGTEQFDGEQSVDGDTDDGDGDADGDADDGEQTDNGEQTVDGEQTDDGEQTGDGDTSDDDMNGEITEPVLRPVETASCASSDPIDWSSAKILAKQDGQGAHTLSVVEVAGEVHVCIEGTLPLDQHYELFIDSDGSAATGSAQGDWAPNGSEFKIADGVAYAAPDWSPASGLLARSQRDQHTLTVVLTKASLVDWYALGFRLLSTDWRVTERLPASGHHFARATFPPSVSSGGGMIIPMYALPPGIVDNDRTPFPPTKCKDKPVLGPATNAVPTDPAAIKIEGTMWERLASAATTLRSGSNQDLWVAVNGPRHRPFQDPKDFERAAVSYDPIVSAGGKIFGYVHTLVDPCDSQLRPLDEVLADAQTWLTGYPNLAGIWIDEYYPKYEYTAGDDLVASFPNGKENASADAQSYATGSVVPAALQLNPSGGYYQRLVDGIRLLGPGLKIIGNAGGPVPSNQLLYSALPDMLCGFEQSQAEAESNGWKRLALPSVLPERPALLALVHTLEGSKLESTFNEALRRGYSYFYATDEAYGALWLRLPAYFDQQVALLAARSQAATPAND